MKESLKSFHNQRILFGFYSQTAEKQFGSVVYQTPDGTFVRVTAVYDDPTGSDYKWPDKQMVGEVIKFIGGSTRQDFDLHQKYTPADRHFLGKII